MLTKEVISKTPLDSLRELLVEMDEGRISLRKLELQTDAARGGKIGFVFRGEAVANLTLDDIEEE